MTGTSNSEGATTRADEHKQPQCVSPKQLMIGFHPAVWAVRNDPPFCPVGRDRWSGGRARHRTCFPKPLQLTNEAQVRVHRRNGVVAAKLENETRSDHRTIVLLQIQEARAIVGCLCIHIGYLPALLSSAVNPPLQAAILAPARDLRQLLRREGPADPSDDPLFLFRPRDFSWVWPVLSWAELGKSIRFVTCFLSKEPQLELIRRD